jgi:hypothetical protein
MLDGPVTHALGVAHLKVTTSRESTPITGEHHTAHPIGIVVQARQQFVHGNAHLHIHCVEHFRAVEGDEEHMLTVAFGKQHVTHWGFKHGLFLVELKG